MPPITNPVTVTIFNRQNRAAGTYQTDTATVPEGVGSLGIKDTMTDAVASNPANSFSLTAQVSPDGVAWQDVFLCYWTGGTHFNRFTQTTVPNHLDTTWADSRMQQGEWVGWSIRAVLVQDVAMAVGLDATVNPM
jgi:hypothetical protein